MEELSEYMLKFEKIKRVIHNFKNDLCPNCSMELSNEYIKVSGKTKYRCKGCGQSFWESQFYETYFDEIIRVVDE